MKSYLRLANRELKSQKVTSVLIILALTFSTLMTTAIGCSLPIVQRLSQDQLKKTEGNFHILMEDPEKTENFYTDKRFETVGRRQILGFSSLGKTSVYLMFESDDEIARSMFKGSFDIIEGRLPENAGEIALEERDFETLGIPKKLDQQVTFNITEIVPHEKKERTFRICGILAPCLKYMKSGYHLALILNKDIPAKISTDSYYIRTADPKKLADANYLEQLKLFYKPKRMGTNNPLLRAMYIFPAGSDPASFWQEWLPMGAVGLLVLFAAGLVIYNIMKISIMKKMGQYGIIRAVGGSSPQIYKILLRYVLILSGIAIPAGLVLGSLISRFLAQIMARRWMGEFAVSNNGELDTLVNQNAFVSIPALLISAGISLFFVLIATLPSIGHVARVSPIVAMEGWQPKLKRKRGKRARPIRCIERHIARTNLSRNKGRTIITILSMVVSVTVVIAMNYYCICREQIQLSNRIALGTFSLVAPAGDLGGLNTDKMLATIPVGFTKEDVENIKQSSPDCVVTGISHVCIDDFWGGTDNRIPTIDKGNFSIYGCNEDALRHLAPDLSKKNWEKLRSGEACLFSRTRVADGHESDIQTKIDFAQEGDVLIVAGKPYALIYDLNYEPEARILFENASERNGIVLWTHENLFNQNFGFDKPYYRSINVYPGKGADLNAVWASVQAVAKKHPGATSIDYRPDIESIKNSFAMMKLLGYSLVLLISLIGVFNIASTTYTNIHTRIKEIGTMRALGMDDKSLYRSFLWEGAFYGLFSAAFGTLFGAGAVLHQNILATGKSIFSAAVWVDIPWLAVILACACAIIICLASVFIPLQKIKKMNIVDSLEFME